MKQYALFISTILFISACSPENRDPLENYYNSVKEDSPYQCDGREYCSEMDSYEEAKYFLDNCPNMKMDGDNDGIPCEKQFSQSQTELIAR